MRLLVLGGTGFLGYHVTEHALERGDEVILFNRGKTRPEAFPGAERIVGDRKSGDLAGLDGVEADAVVDCTGYVPRDVESVADRLAGKVGRYVFVSTISVYAPHIPEGSDEDASLAEMPEGADEETVTGSTYGPLKVRCEQSAFARYGDSATVVRPGLIVGPQDPTDRFTYWIRRGVEGGAILTPDKRSAFQVIDARDLAAFLLRLCDDDRGGTFNAVGDRSTFGELIDLVATDACEIVSRPDSVLLAAGLQPWSDLPMWIPARPDGSSEMVLSNARAKEAGLKLRSLAGTVADTAAWDRERGMPPLRAGIDRARQDEIAAAAL